MRKDPTEFRKRFADWKEGKKVYDGGLPKYEDGKTPYKYTQAGKDREWTRISDNDVSDVFQDMIFRPSHRGGNTTVGNWNRQWSLKGEPGLELVSPESYIMPFAPIATKIAAQLAIKGFLSNSPTMQYIRYPIGKIIYGMNAKFPTIYRKLKAPIPSPLNGAVLISNPKSRFAFETGEESPIITNMTYDAPVRSHSSGDWDPGWLMAMNGRKVLLGKNVVSTEPSDLFTYGSNIKIPIKHVKIISGDADEIAAAKSLGYDVKTSPKLLKLRKEGYSPGVNFTSKNGKVFNLRKEDLSAYSKEMEMFARKLFGSPTKKDVDFMNFVLQPKIKGNVYNYNLLNSLIKLGVEPFGDRLGNAQLRSYLLDEDRWGNLLYDPATHAESIFRKTNGIVLKRDVPFNMRKWPGAQDNLYEL